MRYSDGMLSSSSVIRMITVSTNPPKYPAMPPSSSPSVNEIAMPTSPTVSEICAPYSRRDSTSRPNESLPNRKMRPGASTPKRWTFDGRNPISS